MALCLVGSTYARRNSCLRLHLMEPPLFPYEFSAEVVSREVQDICQTFLRLLTHVVINSSSLTHQCLQKLVTALLPPPFMTKDREAADLESDSDIMHMQIDIVKTIQQVHRSLAPLPLSD